MAALEARSWTEQELRQLILADVQSGETYQAVATAIGSIVAETYATFEAQASQITIQERQVQTNADESNVAKLSMTAEVNALQTKLQDTVKFVEGVPDTVPSLDSRLEAITTWLAASQLSDVAKNLSTLQGHHDTLQEHVGRRLRELSSEISINSTRSAASADFGGFSGPRADKDRNVFDPRDYKLTDLGPKPTAAGHRPSWRTPRSRRAQ